MKLSEVSNYIGKQVTLNGRGDLGIDGHLKKYIFGVTPLTIIKITKNGKVYLQHENEFVTVGSKNIDLIE